MLMRLAVAIALCPLAYTQPGQARTPIQPASVIGDINAHGAAKVVEKLNAGGGSQWREVIRDIERGSPPWLDVAQKLLTGTDAGRTTDLYFGLSLALTRNAAGVLSLVGPDLPIADVCSVPYIEPDDKTIRTYRAKVHTALGKVTSSEFDTRKKACLEAVDR